MIRIFKWLEAYCPHPPRKTSTSTFPLYHRNLWPYLEIKDVKSSLDGLVALVILYGFLFAASFLKLPIASVILHYQLVLLRIILVIAASLLFTYFYVCFRKTRFLELGLTRSRYSIIESFFALSVWATLWLLIAKAAKINMTFDTRYFAIMPLALTVGLMSSLIVYGHLAPKFVKGLGEKFGVLLSSTVGSLLLLAASTDFAIWFLPIVVLFVCIGMRTRSILGPVIGTSLLFGAFCTSYVTSLWITPERQPMYWFMTVASIISAVLTGLFLDQFLHPRLVRGISHEGKSAV